MSTTVPEVSKAPSFVPMEEEIKNLSITSEPIVAASDFKEDPFQNYRYEDPFLISDPFQDEAPPVPVTATVIVKGNAIMFSF